MSDQDITALVNAEVERRLADPVYLRDKNAELAQRLADAVAMIAPLREKAAFYDAVTESDEWMEMAAAVKLLGYKGWGRNKVFGFLRQGKILRSNNEPYQEYVERGYFKIVEEQFFKASGEQMIFRKTVVSNRGVDYLRKLINGEAA